MTGQRLLDIQDGHNFRDLGGYETKDGRHVKWHRLIRSGSLAHLNEHDLSTLAAIPVTIDIDLRAPEEVKQAPDKLPRLLAIIIYRYLNLMKLMPLTVMKRS